MQLFRLKACPKCRGDLAFDQGDWICLQCGTYYYTGLYGENHRSETGCISNSPARWFSPYFTPPYLEKAARLESLPLESLMAARLATVLSTPPNVGASAVSAPSGAGTPLQ